MGDHRGEWRSSFIGGIAMKLAFVGVWALAAAVVAFGHAATGPAGSAPATTDPASKNLANEQTSDGVLAIQPLNHSALRFEFKGKQYYVDPAGQADWVKLPKADAIFITHPHGDHLSMPTINAIKKEGTAIYGSDASIKQVATGTAINPGDKVKVLDISVEAIPAYNLTANRLTYHPKDRKDDGFVLTFANKRVYVAGDTEGSPEMKALKDIDVAFLPINLPYTMTPQEAAEAAKVFKPKVLYPYHQGQSNPAEMKTLLAQEKGIEVRVLALP
jgi:L-ascorbate metabolism protein UlaG (beta-lactamase superfamily)